ncbi:hypothetical protein DV735_g1636, partial [Chaetothyriales sp. CBS 134920]
MGELGGLSPRAGIVLGIIVGLLSTSIQSLGLTLQRKSHLIEDAKELPETRRPAYKRRKWQVGMLMFLASNIIGSTIQITTLPLPILSTLQSAGLVFNTAFATILLKEPFTRYSLIGTLLTCAGAALIATFGAIGEHAHNLQQLITLLKRGEFIAWMVSTLLVVVATILLAHFLKLWSSRQHLERQLHRSHRLSFSSSSMTPTTPLIRRTFTQSLPPPMQARVSRLRFIRGLAYGLISGILSAHSLLMAKSAVELIVRTIADRNNQFNRFESWLIVLALLFFALSQLYYLHLGLRLCSTSVLYPFVFCIYNIIAILDGLIYFKQLSRLSPLHAGLIALGTLVLLAGVVCLSWRLGDLSPEEVSQAAVLPATPLTPGMAITRTSDEQERESLLPSTRPRSSTSASRLSRLSHSPATGRRSRVSTMPTPIPPEDTRDIWAELDDDREKGEGLLVCLPPAPSPFLNQKSFKKRRDRSAISSQTALSTSPTPSRPSNGPSQVLGNNVPSPVTESASREEGRLQGNGVRFVATPDRRGGSVFDTNGDSNCGTIDDQTSQDGKDRSEGDPG